jgi:hypothetical protein
MGLGVAAVILLVCFWPFPTEDLRGALAKQWGEKPEDLYINLPPRPERYPGAVFTSTYGAVIAFTKETDVDLRRGKAVDFRHEAKEMGQVDGSLGAAVFGIVARRSADLDRSVEIPDLCSVEMDVLSIARRLRALGWDANIPQDLFVVLRAYEGHLTYRIERRQSFSSEAWEKFMQELAEKSRGDPAIKLSFEGSSGGREVGVITTISPIVIAYQACPAAFVLRMAPGEQSPQPVPARAPVENVRGAVERLLLLDPERVPALDQTLREIGPAAEVKAVLAPVVERKVPTTEVKHERATRLLNRAQVVLQ